MATSQFKGTILFDDGDFDTDEPLDTVLVRDALIGSALHKADELAQVRAVWVSPVSTLTSQSPDYITIAAPLGIDVASEAGDAWYELPYRAAYCPCIRADGSGYPLRVRLAGASSVSGARVDFAVIVGPRGASARDVQMETFPQKKWTNVTSTAIAWLTPDGGSPIIEIPPSIIGEALTNERAWWTKSDIGGTEVTVEVPMLDVLVLAQTWSASAEPRLYGFSAAEYIGA